MVGSLSGNNRADINVWDTVAFVSNVHVSEVWNLATVAGSIGTCIKMKVIYDLGNVGCVCWNNRFACRL